MVSEISFRTAGYLIDYLTSQGSKQKHILNEIRVLFFFLKAKTVISKEPCKCNRVSSIPHSL